MKQKQDSKYLKAKALMDEYLAAHKLRQTYERDWILRECCRLKTPISREQVIERAEKKGICKASVYNTWKILREAYIIRSTDKNIGKKELYEIGTASRSRLMLVCTQCNKMTEIRDTNIDTPITARPYKNFIMDHYTLYIYGQCRVCHRLAMKKLEEQNKDGK